LKAIESILKGYQGKMILFFFHLVEFFYSLGLEILAPNVSIMGKKHFMQENMLSCIQKLIYSFFAFIIFTKIFMHNKIRMWKITTPMKITIISIIQYYSIKFIPCRFYIWKMIKKMALKPMSKKGYSNFIYALDQKFSKKSQA
jgi:hypothetical protein